MRGNSFFALLAGAAIGVAAGILLAPDKGSETRKKLKEEGKAAILAQLRKLEKALSGYEDDIEEQVAEEA